MPWFESQSPRSTSSKSSKRQFFWQGAAAAEAARKCSRHPPSLAIVWLLGRLSALLLLITVVLPRTVASFSTSVRLGGLSFRETTIIRRHGQERRTLMRQRSLLPQRNDPRPTTTSTALTNSPHETSNVLLLNSNNNYDDVSSSFSYSKHDQETTTPDSLETFASDIATVLKQLRSDPLDPTLPKLFQKTPLPSFTTVWTLEDWKIHTSRWRYWAWIRSVPKSRLLRRVLPHCLVLLGWSCVASWMMGTHQVVSRVALPLTPLSLVSTFVAALLTLRSNQGLDRLNQGRIAFGQSVLYTRDAAQLIAASIYRKDQELGLLLLRYVALFTWLLKYNLRGDNDIHGDDEDLVRTMLPHKEEADYVLRQRKRPVAVVTRFREIIHYMVETRQLPTSEALVLQQTAQNLNHVIMTTERIRASPIPPLYTTHAGRLLIFYLFFLPLALRGSGMLNGIGTVITTLAVGYTMLGLDEISHLLEQPFRLMPLYQLAKNAMLDVGDALVCVTPPLPGKAKTAVYRDEYNVHPPPYW